MNTGRSLVIVAMVVFAFVLASANADITLIDHTFDGTGALGGTSLDVNNVSAGNWVSSTKITADGEVNNTSGDVCAAAYIDLGAGTIGMGSANDVYTLIFDVKGRAVADNDWMTLGFWNAAPPTDANQYANPGPYHAQGGTSWLRWNSGSSLAASTTAGQFYANSHPYYFSTASNRTFTVVLDLTDPTLTANTATLHAESDDRGPIVAPGNFGATDTFRYLGIGSRHSADGDSGAIQSMTISQIPEPATISLLGLFAGIVFLRRRRMS